MGLLLREIRMKRTLAVIAIFGSICLAGSAMAQGPGGPEGFKKKFGPGFSGANSIQKLEAQMEKLSIQIRDLDAFVKKELGGSAHEGKGHGRGHGKSAWKGYGPPHHHGRHGPHAHAMKGHWGYGPHHHGKGPGGPHGFDKEWHRGYGPPHHGKEPGGQGGFDKKASGSSAGGFEKKGFGPPPGAFDKKAFGSSAGGFEKKDSGTGAGALKAASTQERLDHIIREIGELRRALNKQ
jgi:hypothetical protein